MILLNLIVGVALALSASGPDVLLPTPQASQPIRVLSSSYDIDFPNGVSFTLEAEADVEITDVTLFYRLGGRVAKIYGYADFVPSSRVLADFGIRTGGSDFLPSGVEIEYYYVIDDIDGNSLTSDTYLLEYKDPSYRWQSVRHGDLVILWHDRRLEDVIEVANDVGGRLAEVKALLGLERTTPMKAVILNDRREAGRSFPTVSQAATRGHLYGGFAFGDLDIFVLAGLNRDGVIHEMTHLLIDEALSSSRASIPAWLNEGLAMYFESDSGRRAATVSAAARDGNLLPLRGMGSVPGLPRDVRLFYAESWSIVNHMMQVHGTERMAALLRAINEGMPIEDAVQHAYGLTIQQLELDWKVQGSDVTARVSAADPGTVGTSFLIASAVAVAVAAVVIRWLQRIAASRGAQGIES